MTQTTILAAGVTEAISSNVTLAPGEIKTIGLFVAAGEAINPGLSVEVLQATPGGDNAIERLGIDCRTIVLSGPGTFRAKRPQFAGPAVGVLIDA